MFVLSLSAGNSFTSLLTPEELRATCANGSVVVVGNLDGVHRGHQALLKHAQQEAQVRSLPLLVLSFEPSIKEHFAKQRNTEFLSLGGLPVKLRKLKNQGASYLALLAPKPSLLNLSPTEFIDEILVSRFRVKLVCTGEDFCFGKNRTGDSSMLHNYGLEKGLYSTDRIVYETATPPSETATPPSETATPPSETATPSSESNNSESDSKRKISSTAIRECIKKGDLKQVTKLLGAPLCGRGRVVRGMGYGRNLGFPTANLASRHCATWPEGVYVARTIREKNDTAHITALSIGTRESVTHQKQKVVEPHLLDFSGNLYGEYLTIEVLHKIRGQERYHSREELIAAIARDCTATRRWYQMNSI